MSETIETEKVSQTTGTTVIGMEGLRNPTPMAVTWIFRTQFVLNKAVMVWLGATSMVKGENVKEIILVLAAIDFVVWGLGRFIGVKKSDFEN